ncbi:MAG: hypothetical protein JSV45_05035 [Chromatiales bacterium]|nr:MAG: hypothetical protein JSV45_05035 [Chromatiales bacterium]
MDTRFSGLYVAIISLVVAFTALGYNTWRNEQSEFNRNIRRAGFEMLVHISALQRVTYLAHFEMDREGGNPRNGWVEVLVLRDLSMLMPDTSALRAEALYRAWNDNWRGLGEDDLAVAAIDQAIDNLRKDVVAILESLD